MSVILDALKKAQEERKSPSYRDGGGDDDSPRRPKWVFYCIVGAAVCAILLVLFLPELYKMQTPGPQVTLRKDAPPEPPPAPPRAAPEVAPGKPPQVPGKEEFQKFAMDPPKVARLEQPQADRKVRRQPVSQPVGPEARAAKPKPEAEAEKVPAPAARTTEPKAPATPAEDPAVVVKRVASERVTANYNNALFEAERGRPEEAKKLYMAVLADQPGHVEALNNLGVIAMREGNNKEAVFYFRRILEYRKDYSKAYNNLGIVLMRDGEKKMAEEYFRKAIEVAPGSVEPYLNLAALLRSEKRLEEANGVVEAAIRRGHREPTLFLSTALIKDELGQYEEAIKYYRAYLQSSQHKENRRSIVERLTFLEETQSAANR